MGAAARCRGSDGILLGDAQDLPFEDDRVDILICESVNTFVPDLDQVAKDYVRVVKPGWYVG